LKRSRLFCYLLSVHHLLSLPISSSARLPVCPSALGNGRLVADVSKPRILVTMSNKEGESSTSSSYGDTHLSPHQRVASCTHCVYPLTPFFSPHCSRCSHGRGRLAQSACPAVRRHRRASHRCRRSCRAPRMVDLRPALHGAPHRNAVTHSKRRVLLRRSTPSRPVPWLNSNPSLMPGRGGYLRCASDTSQSPLANKDHQKSGHERHPRRHGHGQSAWKATPWANHCPLLHPRPPTHSSFLHVFITPG
jgi:hypothetical protein